MHFRRAADDFFDSLMIDFPLETAILDSKKVDFFWPPEAAQNLDLRSELRKQGGGHLVDPPSLSYNSTDGT